MVEVYNPISITNIFLLFSCFYDIIIVLTHEYPNIWALIRCIQGKENRFNHLLIQMKGGLTVRPNTKKQKLFNKKLIHYIFVMIMVMLLAMNF
jgi:hypothetical protein